MERNITFYRIILYVDDGTNVDYIKPQDLNDTDVFSNSDSAWEWCQGKGYEDNCVIKDENDDILNIGDYHFIDFPDDFSETIYKLQTIGQILCNIDFCIVENKRKYGLIDKHGFLFDGKYYAWKTIQASDMPLMEKILDFAEFDIKPSNSYNLTSNQKSIVDEIFRLVEQATKMDIGFYFDTSNDKMFAFNAENIILVNPTIKKSNAKLTNDIAEGCEITFHGHYNSKKQSLDIVNKSH